MKRKSDRNARRVSRRPLRRDWLSYLIALAATALATGIGLVIDLWLPIADITVVYLLAVLIVAIKSGLRAAITASFASFLVFNFVFTDPRWTFSIDNTQHALTIVLFLVAAVIVSNLASRARAQVEALRRARGAPTSMTSAAGAQPRRRWTTFSGQWCTTSP